LARVVVRLFNSPCTWQRYERAPRKEFSELPSTPPTMVVMHPDLLHRIEVLVAPQAEADCRVAIFVPEPSAFNFSIAIGGKQIARAEFTHPLELRVAMLGTGQKLYGTLTPPLEPDALRTCRLSAQRDLADIDLADLQFLPVEPNPFRVEECASRRNARHCRALANMDVDTANADAFGLWTATACLPDNSSTLQAFWPGA